MSCRDAKVGDIIIANSLADNRYVYTRNNWIGIITRINVFNDSFTAHKYDDEAECFGNLDFDCFDFYPLTSAQELARELGFEMEGI